MLVVTRKESQAIRIGDDIRVVIVRSGSTVRLGIEAPDGVRIIREEIMDKYPLQMVRHLSHTFEGVAQERAK